MSLKRKIAHNTLVQLFGKSFSTLLGLLSVFIMTRTLGAEKFGWYTTAVGFLQFIGIFSDFGFTITTANMLSEPKFQTQKLLNTLFSWRLLSAAVFQGLAPLIFLFFPYPLEVKIAVAIMSISFFAVSVSNVFTGYYQMQLKTQIHMSGELLGRIFLIVGISLIAKFGLGFLPIMSVISLASIVNAGYLFYRMPRINFGFDKEISLAIFAKIWPTALCVIFNSFYLQGDRVILPLFVKQSEVGFYGAAYRVLDIIIQMSALIMGIMAPLLAYSWSRNQTDDFKKRLQMSFDLIALFLIPMMFGAIALAEPIMRFVGGQEFSSAGKILTWLSWAIFGICFGMVFGYTSFAINRQREAIWIYLVDSILSIIGYFIFIPRFGIYGAAGVTIFSEIFAGLGLMFLTAYYSKFLPHIKSLFKIIIAGLIMYASITLCPLPHVLLSIVFGGFIYALLILLLRVISKDTIKEIIPFNN